MRSRRRQVWYQSDTALGLLTGNIEYIFIAVCKAIVEHRRTWALSNCCWHCLSYCMPILSVCMFADIWIQLCSGSNYGVQASNSYIQIDVRGGDHFTYHRRSKAQLFKRPNVVFKDYGSKITLATTGLCG
jgi:hypothetical protein